MLGEEYINGRTHDLSGFGVDFSEPVSIRLEIANDRAVYQVNGRDVYQDQIRKAIGSVVGLQIRFTGTRMIQNVVLRKSR